MADPLDNTASGAVSLGALTLFGNKLLSGTVQSYTSGSFAGRTATITTRDSADYYRIGPIDPGILEVRLKPKALAAPTDFNLTGVSGVVQHLEFSPGGAFGGNTVAIEVRIGYSRFGAEYDGLQSRLASLRTALVADPSDTRLNSDRTYFNSLNTLGGQLIERASGNVDATVSARIEADAASIASRVGSLTYGGELAAIARTLVSLADQWTVPAYYLGGGGELAAVQFSDITKSVAWSVSPGTDGFVRVSGYEAVAVTSSTPGTLPSYRIEAINYGLSDVAVLSQTEARTVVGSSAGDSLRGGSAADLLIAGAGNDTLNGLGGADQMFGGSGSDTYVVDDAGDRAIETNSSTVTGGIDRVLTYINYVLPANVENATLLNGGLRLTGNSAANVLTGTSAVNTLIGGAGDDIIYGGANATSPMRMGSGVVLYDVNRTNEGYPIPIGNFSLANNPNIFGSTTVPHVTIDAVGAGATATFELNIANAGARLLIDVDGARGFFIDPFAPRPGFDSVVVLRNSNFQVVATNDDKFDFVNNINSADPGSNSLEDSFLRHVVTAPGTYYLEVKAYPDNPIPFGWNFDVHVSIDGELGFEVLSGGAGRDILNGGLGRDSFDFNAISESLTSRRDVITDFARGIDVIDLRDIDANIRVAGNQAFSFIGGRAFTGAAGQLHYRLENPSGTTNDKTIIEGDVNGDRRADFAIELRGLIALGAGDFVL